MRVKLGILLFFFSAQVLLLAGTGYEDVRYILDYTKNRQIYRNVDRDFPTVQRMKIFVEDFVLLYNELEDNGYLEELKACKAFWENYFVDHNIFEQNENLKKNRENISKYFKAVKLESKTRAQIYTTISEFEKEHDPTLSKLYKIRREVNAAGKVKWEPDFVERVKIFQKIPPKNELTVTNLINYFKDFRNVNNRNYPIFRILEKELEIKLNNRIYEQLRKGVFVEGNTIAKIQSTLEIYKNFFDHQSKWEKCISFLDKYLKAKEKENNYLTLLTLHDKYPNITISHPEILRKWNVMDREKLFEEFKKYFNSRIAKILSDKGNKTKDDFDSFRKKYEKNIPPESRWNERFQLLAEYFDASGEQKEKKAADLHLKFHSLALSYSIPVPSGVIKQIIHKKFINLSLHKNNKGYWEADIDGHRMVYIPILKAFVDKYEVSYAQFAHVMKDNRKKNGRPLLKKLGNKHPAVVSFEEAETYCKKKEFRLLSEDEWKIAAGSKLGYIYPWGSEEPLAENICRANFDTLEGDKEKDGHKTIAPVKSFEEFSSPFGVVNMAGNVSEWVQGKIRKGGDFISRKSDLKIEAKSKTEEPGGFRCVKEVVR